MSALLIILLGTVLIQGSALVLGGARPAVHARISLATELREAAFTIAAMTLSAVLGFVVTHHVLTSGVMYLRTPAIVLTTAAAIIITRALVDASTRNAQHQVLVILTGQCALLGIALFSAYFADSLLQSFVYGFVTAISLAILNAAFSALIERVDTDATPFVFRGIPVALISAGLMALALMGFAGIVHN